MTHFKYTFIYPEVK